MGEVFLMRNKTYIEPFHTIFPIFLLIFTNLPLGRQREYFMDRRLGNFQNWGKFQIMEGLRYFGKFTQNFGKFIQNRDCIQIIRPSIHLPTVLVYWIISTKFKDFHIFRLRFYYFSAPFFTCFSIHLIYKLKKWTHLIHSVSIQINNLDSTYPYYGLILPNIPPQW